MKKAIDIEIGGRIRQSRESLNLTRDQLAEKIDLSRSSMDKIELGVNGASLQTIKNLCEVLHVSADYLIFGSDSNDRYSRISEMLSGMDEKYFPDMEALVAAYIRSIALAEEREPER